MFATGCWIEGRRNQVLNLPVTSRLMTSLLDFLYTDELKVGSGDDPEFFCNLLVTADQFLIPRLIQVSFFIVPPSKTRTVGVLKGAIYFLRLILATDYS